MNSPVRHSPRTPSELAVHAALGRMRCGALTLVGRDGRERAFTGDEPGPCARVEVRAPGAARRILGFGATGLAEGYIAGDWDTPDLDAVLDLGVANLAPKPAGAPAPLNPVQRAWHAMRDNTPAGSKRNIAEHYDLGNDFYRLWLDDTMSYSSAMFPAEDLAAAQRRKWDRLLELLQPDSRDHLLEIGCGWGGFAMHAARETGCRVTAVTLSREQHAWASRAVHEAGLDSRIHVRLQDYRAIHETFSAIASIEMFEAVGERWWPVFFTRVRDMLEPGGVAALQTITIEEHRFEDYRRKPDFIQRYVFPGGMLPSPERFAMHAADAGLTVGEPHFFGSSYAQTLSHWRDRFEEALPSVEALGFDERFVRLWRYYLSYCRAGFSAGTVDVMQVRLEA